MSSDVKTLFRVIWTVALLIVFKSEVTHSNTDDGELIFVNTVCRHGDRNLMRSYPDDPWKAEENWPEGYAQLTRIGKQQHYLMGQYMRKRYSSLLGDGSYSPNLVYIRSTDVDRVIMSAQSCLAGLFPPTENEIWNEEIRWHPIPVHMIPKKDDHMLTIAKKCDRFDYEMIKFLNESNYEGLFRQYGHLIGYLETKTGLKINSLLDIMFLYDALNIERMQGKQLPTWARHVMVQGGNFEFLATLWFQLHTSTNELKKFKGGYLLKDILDRFTEKIQSKLTPNRSLWLYFAHDITITTILNSMGLLKMHFPPYASCLFFELYKTNSSNYVQIYYKKGIDMDIPALNIPECGTKCPLEKLYELYDEILPTESFDKACKLRDGEVIPPGGNPEQFEV